MMYCMVHMHVKCVDLWEEARGQAYVQHTSLSASIHVCMVLQGCGHLERAQPGRRSKIATLSQHNL